jgi:hypothetical protein
MNNPYESPQTEHAAGREPVSRRESSNILGCFFVFLSLLIFITVSDMALVTAVHLHRVAFAGEANVVRFAPLSCLIAWLMVFHLPIGKRLRLAPLRRLRRISALGRHFLLWAVLILLFIWVGSL